MLSLELLNAAIFEGLSDADPANNVYRPLGSDRDLPYTVTDSIPKDAIDLTNGAAQVVISGAMPGGSYPNYGSLARVPVQIVAIAAERSNAGYLSEALMLWFTKQSCETLPMQGQAVQTISITSMGGPQHDSKREYYTAAFTVNVALSVF